MGIDYENLNIKIKNNTITNISDIINEIKSIEINKESSDYLESLLNRLKFMNIKNNNILIDLIKKRLFAYYFQNDFANLNNKDCIDLLMEFNDNLKVNIALDKDGEEHLYYIDSDNYVFVITLPNKLVLREFIRQTGIILLNINTANFFNKISEYIHKISHTTNKIVITEDSLNNYNRVKEYAVKFGFSKHDVKQITNCFNENIFTVRDGIIKFSCIDNIIDVIKKPTLELSTEKENIELIKDENTTDRTYGEIDIISDISFDVNILARLIIKKCEDEILLSDNEENLLNAYIKTLIETINDRRVNFEKSEEDILLDKYIKYLLVHKSTPLDTEFIEKYAENIEFSEHFKNQRKLIKKDEKMNENKSSGLATVIILLEICLVAFLVFIFL